jgi:selenium metabolism protein YedF
LRIFDRFTEMRVKTRTRRVIQMKTIDTKGLTCPKPLILVKEALLDLAEGEKVCILTDNETSLSNLISYLTDQGVEPEVSSEDGVHTLVTQKPAGNVAQSDPAAYCNTGVIVNNYVVCIKSELMGDGDPELGKVLMETFVDNLKLQEQLPTHVVLYNGGVKLAMKRSPVCNSLSELEELGTRIMLCGTCIDHYGLQYDIGVGMISNMVVITETLASAGHVVSP